MSSEGNMSSKRIRAYRRSRAGGVATLIIGLVHVVPPTYLFPCLLLNEPNNPQFPEVRT
jgi:hypothetical protein